MDTKQWVVTYTSMTIDADTAEEAIDRAGDFKGGGNWEAEEVGDSPRESRDLPTGYPFEFDHGITVGQYESDEDGAHLVWIDTTEDTGHIRVYLNDGSIPLFDGDPEKVDHPLMQLRKEFEAEIGAALAGGTFSTSDMVLTRILDRLKEMTA